VAAQDDPVLVRRAVFAKWAERGQRVGYALLGVAVVAFVVAIAANFPGPTVAIVIAALVGATLVLPPAIVTGYAVKAAEREERELRGRAAPPPAGPRGRR
jgi:hypothetical protein